MLVAGPCLFAGGPLVRPYATALLHRPLQRWIATPAAKLEGGPLREGTQFVFPASEGEALSAAIEHGTLIYVWGIQARTAAVVMMFAWARAETDPANFVKRLAWFPVFTPGRERLTLSGRILLPPLSPQGKPIGVILTEPSRAIRLPIVVHAALRDILRLCSEVMAEALGTGRGGLEAIDAKHLGQHAASLQPLPAGTKAAPQG